MSEVKAIYSSQAKKKSKSKSQKKTYFVTPVFFRTSSSRIAYPRKFSRNGPHVSHMVLGGIGGLWNASRALEAPSKDDFRWHFMMAGPPCAPVLCINEYKHPKQHARAARAAAFPTTGPSGPGTNVWGASNNLQVPWRAARGAIM